MDAVPKGQYEACQVLGMTKSQAFIKVAWPQIYKNILPPMSNEIITLVKDTSLARIIGLAELIFAGQDFLNKGYLAPFFATALFYLAFVEKAINTAINSSRILKPQSKSPGT